jgi:hypothetical protein
MVQMREERPARNPWSLLNELHEASVNDDFFGATYPAQAVPLAAAVLMVRARQSVSVIRVPVPSAVVPPVASVPVVSPVVSVPGTSMSPPHSGHG